MRIPIPFDTAQVLNNDQKILSTENFSLLFHKYLFKWGENWHLEEKEKGEFRRRLTQWRRSGDKYLKAFIKRQETVIASLKASNWHVSTFHATTDSRLIVGLGGESVLETGLTLHPLYGFPYIPATTLKGLARAYAEIVEEADKALRKQIFGSEDKDPEISRENIQGRVFFLDGIPERFPALELDIMNPHYGDYYQGKTDSKGNPIPPADYLDANPVTFLTVSAGTRFHFALYSKDPELLKKAEEWLKGGLTELGAGGKTNVGYGYFRIEPARESTDEKDQIPLETVSSLRERLKGIKNKETFIEFVKGITTEDIKELQSLSFEGMESVINIGVVDDFIALEISSEIKKTIAEKMLQVIKPGKKWDEEKKERYRRLKKIIEGD